MCEFRTPATKTGQTEHDRHTQGSRDVRCPVCTETHRRTSAAEGRADLNTTGTRKAAATSLEKRQFRELGGEIPQSQSRSPAPSPPMLMPEVQARKIDSEYNAPRHVKRQSQTLNEL